MRYESVADIYSANERLRERFISVARSISPDDANALPDGEKWTAGQIVEHVAIVENSILKICTKLAAAARETNKAGDGSFEMTDEFKKTFFGAAEMKIEAPQRVHPTGSVGIEDSLASIAETSAAFDALRPEIEAFDGRSHTFPHPHFGNLTAAEWMVVRGGHESRHADQIERVLEKLRK